MQRSVFHNSLIFQYRKRLALLAVVFALLTSGCIHDGSSHSPYPTYPGSSSYNYDRHDYDYDDDDWRDEQQRREEEQRRRDEQRRDRHESYERQQQRSREIDKLDQVIRNPTR